ncbi:MAG: hypothetical protein CME70_07655 [Halobacteriovorax sp.]|nr:hypothetical protein [Halobacteriovorax sp.]
MTGKEIPDSAKRAYRERLKYLRRGQEAFQGKEVSKAVQFYATYLKALADYFGVPENHLDPKFFDLQKDKAELLLVSQVYWDLSKAYDRSPGLQSECIRCLAQFVKFTIGFKHQHINAQLLKKYLRHNSAVNQQAFKGAFTKIQVDSKKCYIATYAFGENHHITCSLRSFKADYLNHYALGIKFISAYYHFSPRLVSFSESNPLIGKALLLVFRPVIFAVNLFVNTWRKICLKS